VNNSPLTTTDIIDVLHEASDPVVSTNGIAEQLGYSRQHIDEYLRKLTTDRIRYVDIGGSKGWYLNETIHPAEIIERQIDGKRITKLAEPDCNQCHKHIHEGDEFIALFERSGREWEVLDAICTAHSPTRGGHIAALGYASYLENATNSVEFAVLQGVADRVVGAYQEETLIRDPLLVEYYPRTKEGAQGEVRPPEYGEVY